MWELEKIMGDSREPQRLSSRALGVPSLAAVHLGFKCRVSKPETTRIPQDSYKQGIRMG